MQWRFVFHGLSVVQEKFRCTMKIQSTSALRLQFFLILQYLLVFTLRHATCEPNWSLWNVEKRYEAAAEDEAAKAELK